MGGVGTLKIGLGMLDATSGRASSDSSDVLYLAMVCQTHRVKFLILSTAMHFSRGHVYVAVSIRAYQSSHGIYTAIHARRAAAETRR